VLRAALAFDPEERPASAADLADRLEGVARREQGATRPDEGVLPDRSEVRGVARLAGLAVLTALLAAVVTWWVLGLLT
jgi:hypothetical protein